MNDKLDFMVYCIETYKNVKGLKGKDTVELFNRYRVFDYIKATYEALHTTGNEYIVEDLDIYINERSQMNTESKNFN
ncbi:DUF3791 domain-containing protein [Radiobacillus sp. PE A8.2]|uniref:DUF3791 domain-containing protein n=1 Tax=Radiobacillus sp. PE A8.2 TaxID=3380349 RepID=UPI00388D3E36